VRRRRFLVGGLTVLALAAFLAVKLEPSHGGPPVDISSGGSEGHRARSVLANALTKLFPKANGSWRILTPTAGADPGAQCVESAAPFRRSTGYAATAPYLFAGWLEVRLASFLYVNASTAQRAFAAPDGRGTEICIGRVVVKELERLGYAVGKPRWFPSAAVHIGDEGKSNRIVIPTRYKSRRYTWDVDTSTARRGRLVLAVGTVVAEPFQRANEGLTRELVAVL
jgi:hypothetical protein